MGTEDKPGFLASKWMTIILIAVLVILALIFIWIQSAGGFGNFFDKFKKKKDVKPSLRPPGTAMNQQFHSPGERPTLELVDSGFIILTETELS